MKKLFKKTSLLTGLFVLLALNACSFKTEPANYYVLKNEQNIQMSQSNSTGLNGPSISILPVELPSYLARPEMISRDGQVNILVHEFHEWAEDLTAGIARVISYSLSQRLESVQASVSPMYLGLNPDYLIKIEILNFVGELGESTQLQARWAVEQGNKVLRQEFFSTSLPLQAHNVSDGDETDKIFEDYVSKNSQLLESLAENINQFLLPLLSKK